MKLSYWEYKSWLSNIDFTIIGSGIVGINCALQLRKKFPKAKILILEKGVLPQGASTKNAGFACFGSITEILADLKTHTEEELINLVQERKEGIQALRDLLGDKKIGFHLHGGHELFLKSDKNKYEQCVDQLNYVNGLLKPVFKEVAFAKTTNTFGFKNCIDSYITHKHEGQINTGLMMKSLLDLVYKSNITILNAITVESVQDNGNGVIVKTNQFEFTSKKVFIATNGFAKQLIKEEVQPARAQVLITKPIDNLHVKGTFHLDQGYYYFRNIDNRILLGGGRNLDFKTEETFELGNTKIIQDKLKELLTTVILPETPFEIDFNWSGIMGIGSQKKPIVKEISKNIACGVRLGGMGVAIGTRAGQQLANTIQC